LGEPGPAWPTVTLPSLAFIALMKSAAVLKRASLARTTTTTGVRLTTAMGAKLSAR
jgi:hypothetical protein